MGKQDFFSHGFFFFSPFEGLFNVCGGGGGGGASFQIKRKKISIDYMQ